MKKVNKWTFLAFALITAIITVLTIVASVQSRLGADEIILQTVVMVYVFAAFVILMVIGLFLWKPRKTVYSFGFYVLHIGLIMFLAGGFLFWAAGDTLHVNTRIDSRDQHGFRNFYAGIDRMNGDRGRVNLPFAFRVAAFYVEYYDPEIYGVIGMPRHYDVTLEMLALDARDDDYETVTLQINRPVRNGGWKIYLMSRDPDGQFLHLMLKHDPGEIMSHLGTWAIMIGSVMMCLIRKRMKGDDVVDEGAAKS